MSCAISKYLEAVSRREAFKLRGVICNWGELEVITKDDIPRLIEIVNVQRDALNQILEIAGEDRDLTGDDAQDMGSLACLAHHQAELLAKKGQADWDNWDKEYFNDSN